MQDALRPTTFGRHNVRCPNYVAQEAIAFPPDARRYEAGSHNLLGLVGMKAALELLLEIGIENIAKELLRKRAMIISALQGKNYSVLQGESTPAQASGIVSFFKAGKDINALHLQLRATNMVA